MSLNKAMLIGNVGQDPTVRYLDGNTGTGTNTKVASFTLATTERYRDRSGNLQENTEWHNIVAWRGLADTVERFVRKGSQLYIEGRLRTRSYTDQSGQKRYTTEVVADNLQLLGRRTERDNDNPAPEGKGKIVDVLAGRYGVVARFQGGPNAGHSLHFDGKSFVVRSIPSGIFREGSVNIIGNGVVLDPISFIGECDSIREATGIAPEKKLVISRKAHLILPTHRLLDAAREAAAGKGKIGSTLKGIGPCYSDKTGRTGLRVGDTELPGFRDKYLKLTAKHKEQLAHLGFAYGQEDLEEDKFFAAIERMKAFRTVDCEFFVDDILKEQPILAEGAQGSMLDVDYGSYPFVTSSNTTAGGVCTGLGVAPGRIGKVYGIFKAYCTRVGGGPFPTELFDEVGERLGEVGHEYGVTTGRKRRCGWYDAVVVNYAARVNGLTDLAITKLDVLGCLDEIRVCVAYECDGKIYRTVPEHQSVFYHAKPVYETLPGWKCDISGVRDFYKLPREAKDYIDFLEQLAGVRVSIITVGPDREQTIDRYWH